MSEAGTEPQADVKILFLHNNFPAQFGSLGQYLNGEGWDVTFLTKREGAEAKGIRTVVYRDRDLADRGKGVHGLLRSTNDAVVTGASVVEVGKVLSKRGYTPDIIVAHSGWGPGIFVKDIWPDAVYVAYCEWYYNGQADDLTFLRGREATPEECARERFRNAPILADLVSCDMALVPTRYQAKQFPEIFQEKIRVLHDGIDTNVYTPRTGEAMTLDGVDLGPGDEIVTYVARGMEPYRGFPAFMRALETLQKERPQMKAVILGEDRVAYGAKLPEGDSWKKRMLEELDLDLSRIAMPGLAPRPVFGNVLALSSAHCYLTVPFVLSWSMLEAMSSGCLMVASDTAPVRELIDDGKEGLLCDMRDPGSVVANLRKALDGQEGLQPLRDAARQRILSGYQMRDQFAAKKVLFSELINARRLSRGR